MENLLLHLIITYSLQQVLAMTQLLCLVQNDAFQISDLIALGRNLFGKYLDL